MAMPNKLKRGDDVEKQENIEQEAVALSHLSGELDGDWTKGPVDVNVRRFGAPGKKDEWLTPPGILNRLGEFDLDPCTPIDRPWDTAKLHYNVVDDGLKQEWFGRVWLNPPFGPRIFEWVEKLAQHGDGIALIPARTETKGFHSHVWGVADGVFFFKGRQAFHNVDGSVANGSFGAPCCLICYGKHNVRAVLTSGIDGVMVFDA